MPWSEWWELTTCLTNAPLRNSYQAVGAPLVPNCGNISRAFPLLSRSTRKANSTLKPSSMVRSSHIAPGLPGLRDHHRRLLCHPELTDIDVAVAVHVHRKVVQGRQVSSVLIEVPHHMPLPAWVLIPGVARENVGFAVPVEIADGAGFGNSEVERMAFEGDFIAPAPQRDRCETQEKQDGTAIKYSPHG